jgi:hypothetical protein
LKYLIIAAVVGLLFVLVYSRLRPYIKLAQKVLKFFSDATTTGVDDLSTRRTNPKLENRLLRCDICGTWIPEDRAFKLRAGLGNYCSRECFEKSSGSQEHKAAG